MIEMNAGDRDRMIIELRSKGLTYEQIGRRVGLTKTGVRADAPIEPAYVKQMQSIAVALDEVFNGDKTGDDRGTGFVLLVFPYGNNDGRCNYISNGADRGDVVKLLREQIARFEEG
jgi:hypothetical protein